MAALSSLSLMRLYWRLHNGPRLAFIGNVGISYTTPMIERYQNMYREELGRSTGSPELAAAANVLVRKGAMGAYNFRRFYSTSTGDIKKAEKEREEKNKFKVKTEETIKVLLVTDTGSISSVTLEEANKIAKKKALHLVKCEHDKPVKTEKAVFKLVSKIGGLENDAELPDTAEKERSNKNKELKTVLLKSNTADHDVISKVNIMKKWVKKGHRIRIAIAGDKGDPELIFEKIQMEMKEVDGVIQQRVKKGNELRFYVGPPKNPSTTSVNVQTKSKSKTKHAEVVEDDDIESISEDEVKVSKKV